MGVRVQSAEQARRVAVASWGALTLVLGEIFQSASKRGIQPSNCPKDQREATPNNPGPRPFEPMRGQPCRVNPVTGEVWCHDRLHKDHWEVYKDKRDWEAGRRDRAVWDNGCLRQKF
jgi:hypothetical protein